MDSLQSSPQNERVELIRELLLISWLFLFSRITRQLCLLVLLQFFTLTINPVLQIVTSLFGHIQTPFLEKRRQGTVERRTGSGQTGFFFLVIADNRLGG